MATVTRRADSALEDQILKQTYEFDFHQAIRILEALNPGCVPLGEGGDPREEAVSIKARITYSVSSSDLYSLSYDTVTPTLSINFLGIAGIQGPLPMPYTELLVERLRQKDTSFLDFLDIFNHRLASLWHRARRKTVLGMSFLPPEQTPAGKSFLDLIGLESEYLQNKLVIPDRVLLSNAALLWQRPRSATGLKVVLEAFFKKPIKIIQFIGKWRASIAEDQSRIGINGQYNALGQDALLGCRSWHQASSLAIQIGPLSWGEFLDYIHQKEHYLEMRDLSYFYTGIGTNLFLKLILIKEQIPPTALNSQFALGQTTWLTRGNGKGFAQNPEIMLDLH